MTDCPEVFDFRASSQEGDRPRYSLVRPVFLVGFMGAGKTSAARKLARRAGVASIDTDRYIERQTQRKIADLFAEQGEEGFRAIETCVLKELAQGDPALISCGGGVVVRPENRAVLKESGFVVYLQVTAEEAASRISNVASRPLFGDMDQVQRVIEGRLALYEEVADAVVDTAGKGSAAIAREVCDVLKREGVLRR